MILERSNCFVPLATKAQDLFDYLTFLIKEPLPWQKHFGFDAVEINSSWIDKEPALHQVHQHLPIQRLGLLRVLPFSFYDWHVDQHRLSCINMLINVSHHSHCLFAEQLDPHTKDVCELRYSPRTYYLFNNQVTHAVLNAGGPRYMFSLYFETETKYEDAKDCLKDLLITNEF